MIEARNREIERTKPQAKMVQKAYQLILDEFTNKPDQATRTNIIKHLKPRFSGFHTNDIIFWVDRAIEKASKEMTIWV